MATALVTALHEVCWRIVPEETPRVLRRCPACQEVRPHRSSGRFRVNAHQRRVDVWSIYRCEGCDGTWNCTLYTRRLPEEIGMERFEAFQRNDPAAAWEHAWDLPRIRNNGVQIDAAVPYRVDRTGEGEDLSSGCRIRLEVPYPVTLRLERLLAGELGVARGALGRMLEAGRLQVWPEQDQPLRRQVQDGLIVVMRPSRPGD